MLKHRLIARFDIKAPNLVKTVRMEGLRVVGDPFEIARAYDSQGIDEILYLDIVASLYGRNALAELVAKTSAEVFCPITVGGGIRSIEDAREMFQNGADKIAINTSAIKRPALINELVAKFGSQAVVIQIDGKMKDGSHWEAWFDGGREPSSRSVTEWANEVVDRGAGEILLTSIDREGTGQGFDIDLIKTVSQAVSVPVVASGGFGRPDDAIASIEAGASATAIANALHYNHYLINEIKNDVHKSGHPVRMVA